jgi:hypothetical protein
MVLILVMVQDPFLRVQVMHIQVLEKVHVVLVLDYLQLYSVQKILEMVLDPFLQVLVHHIQVLEKVQTREYQTLGLEIILENKVPFLENEKELMLVGRKVQVLYLEN